MELSRKQLIRLPTDAIEKLIHEANQKRHILNLARNALLNDSEESIAKTIAEYQHQIDEIQRKIQLENERYQNRHIQLTKNKMEINKTDKHIQFLQSIRTYKRMLTLEENIRKDTDSV